MFSFFTKLLDSAVIRMACAAQPKPGTFEPNVEECCRLLGQPDLLDCPVSAPEKVVWTGEEEFQFPSQFDSPWPENNTVYAKLQRVRGKWQEHPTILLVHGWNDEIGYVLRHPFQARKFLKAGINVAQVELPYHLKRRPRRPGAVNDFLTEDLRCTVMAAKQAVMDIRTMLAWLRAQGCQRNGVLGVSLGGWLTGLVAAHDDHVDFAVMNVPVARMDRVVTELPFAEPLRRSVKIAKEQNMEISFERMNLRSLRPRTPAGNILIIEAVDDLFACKEAIEEFWDLWGRPEIWRVDHAHISGLFSLGLLNRQVKWVREKAAIRAVKDL